MVDQSTQQFMYRSLVVTFCVLLIGGFAFIGAVALWQGDGEAVRFADSLAPYMLGAFLTIGGIVTGHNLMSAKVAIASITAGIVPPAMTVPASATPPSAVAVPHPQLVPSAPALSPVDVQPAGMQGATA